MNYHFTDSTALFRLSFSRFFSTTVPYFLIVIAFPFFSPTQLLTKAPLSFQMIYGLTLLSSSVRLLFVCKNASILKAKNESQFRDRQAELQKKFILYSALGVVCWSAMSTLAIHILGAYKPESLFVYLCLLLISTTAAPTLAPNKKIWIIFISLLSAPVNLYSFLSHPDGNFAWFFVSAILSYIVYRNGLSNVGHLKALLMEKEDQRNQLDYLESVINSVPGLVTIFDKDLNYRMINSQVKEFTGLKDEDFYGKKLGFANTDLFTDFVKKFSQSDALKMQSRIRLDGAESESWFLVSLSRLNKYSQIIAVSVDINDQVQAEEEADEQRSIAESSTRMAAIGDFAAGIAHEFNNPLAIIGLSAEQIKRLAQSSGQSDISDLVDRVQLTVDRVAKIVRNLLDFANNKQDEEFLAVSVFGLINPVVSMFNENLMIHNISVDLQIPTTLKLECQQSKIQQVILCLLDNAYDELKDRKNGKIQIKVEDKHDSIEISVTDNGPGIPEQNRDKIMSPFFTTKPAGQGAGLGLAAARRIAQAHRGELYFESLSSGQTGTRFVLKIPVRHQDNSISLRS